MWRWPNDGFTSVELDGRASRRSARRSVGAVQLEHGRASRSSLRPAEASDAGAGADARTRDRVPERQDRPARRSSTTTATSCSRRCRRPPAPRRSPACCSRIPWSRASSCTLGQRDDLRLRRQHRTPGPAAEHARRRRRRGRWPSRRRRGRRWRPPPASRSRRRSTRFIEHRARLPTSRAAIDWGDGSRPAARSPRVRGDVRRHRQPRLRAGRDLHRRRSPWTTSTAPSSHADARSRSARARRTTSVTCSPSPVAVTASTMCTATVSDAGAGGPITPAGTVAFELAHRRGVVRRRLRLRARCDRDSWSRRSARSSSRPPSFRRRRPGSTRFTAATARTSGSSDSAIIGVRAQRCSVEGAVGQAQGAPARSWA